MDLNAYKIDPALAEEGRWIELDVDTSLLVRRYTNTKFKRRLEALMLPYKNSVARGTLSQSIRDEILTRAIAEEILIDWKGVKIDGKIVKYSSKVAYDVMIKPEFTDFRDHVVSLAQDIDNFRAQEKEQLMGK